MPHLFADIPDKLRMILSQAANIFLAVVLIYIIQYIFNSEFSCSCTPEFHYIGYIYILVIPLILFLVLKIVRQTSTKVCAVSCGGLCPHIFQFIGIYLFWWGFVLLDGDLYVCVATKFNDSLVEIPCKTEPTLHEKSMITIYKNWSQFCGYILIAIGFFGWFLMLNTRIGICCDNCCQKCLNNCYKRKPYYKRRYEELLYEETDEYLDKTLRKIAKKKAKNVCLKYIDSIKSSQIGQLQEVAKEEVQRVCSKCIDSIKSSQISQLEENEEEEQSSNCIDSIKSSQISQLEEIEEEEQSVCSKCNNTVKSSQLSQENGQTPNTPQPSQTSVDVEVAWSTISQPDFYTFYTPEHSEQCDKSNIAGQTED